MHELDDIDDNKRNAIQYRFAGYQLPKIILDETGPSYVVLTPHPYYRNQPLYWQKAAYVGSDLPATGIEQPSINSPESNPSENANKYSNGSNYSTSYTEGLLPLLPNN